MKAILVVLSLFATTTAFAKLGGIYECGELNRIDNLMHYSEGHYMVKSYANGDIRAIYVSTEEPAAAPDHLLLLIADPEHMSNTCVAVSRGEGLGFGSIDFEDIKSSYDAKKGLLLEVPVKMYDDETAMPKPAGVVKVRINRSEDIPKVTIE